MGHKRKNEAAFPRTYSECFPGMDLRDYFAAKLINPVFMDKMELVAKMAALLIADMTDLEEGIAELENNKDLQEMIELSRDSVAKECYAMADAMLKAREEQ